MALRLALGLEYDGRSFRGWQTQPGGDTVQDAVEAALAKVHGAPVATIVAGRTDAGVHATAQVLHFDAQHARPESAWTRGVNAHLPAGVAVLWAREVAPEFHARFGAVERAYRYYLLNHPVRPALMAGRVGWIHRALDLDAMRQAAGHLLGLHDFSAFRAAECQAKSPFRDLRRADVAKQGDYIVFEFRANAFLHHQVRNMVWAGARRIGSPRSWRRATVLAPPPPSPPTGSTSPE
jgi:tRNA pseudouridine38-40 synthase